MMDSYIQIVFASGFVIGLLLVFYGISLRKKRTEMGLINIVAYRIIDHKRGIGVAVLKIGGELLFVGITPGDMRVLKSMPDNSSNYEERIKYLKREIKGETS